MRTLATEVQLRRLLRAHADLVSRLGTESDPELPAVARARLSGLIENLRQGWERDLAAQPAPPELPALRRHFARALTTMEAAVAEMERPGTDLGFLSQTFRETALPLMFFLRGLEDVSDREIRQALSRSPLGRTA